MSRKYVVVDSSRVGTFDFNQILETSEESLRYNISGDQVVVKFLGALPKFLSGESAMLESEVRTILRNPEWTPEEENI